MYKATELAILYNDLLIIIIPIIGIPNSVYIIAFTLRGCNNIII